MLSIDFSSDVSDTVRRRAARSRSDDPRPIDRAWRGPACRRIHGRRRSQGARHRRRAAARSVDIPLHERGSRASSRSGRLSSCSCSSAGVGSPMRERAFAPLALEQARAARHRRRGRRAGACARPHRSARRDPDRLRPRLHAGETTRPDHVAGVHGPSLTLSHLTVRRPVETALDVGTGNGHPGDPRGPPQRARRRDRRQRRARSSSPRSTRS